MFLALYLIATTVLFGSVPWSKFAHMFFKPAAAFRKGSPRRTARGSNLPCDPPTSAREVRQRAPSMPALLSGHYTVFD